MNNLKNKTNNIKLADTVKLLLILSIGLALPLQVIAQPQASKVPLEKIKVNCQDKRIMILPKKEKKTSPKRKP